MSDIVAFLNARLDEDQAAAEAATPGPWHYNPGAMWLDGEAFESFDRSKGEEFVGYGGPRPFIGCVAATGPASHPQSMADAAYIARHDPARVLREVKAKRAIVADHPVWPPPEMTERELHEHYAHPAYEYATTEGRRKAWDNADEPPEGEGWERNIDAGRNGWERFDYTEESYWRRLNPEGPRPWRPPLVLRHLAAVYADHPDYDQSWSVG